MFLCYEAYRAMLSGDEAVALCYEDGSSLLEMFPKMVAKYVVRRPNVRVTDRRRDAWPWNNFDYEILDQFIRNEVIPDSVFAGSRIEHLGYAAINVRRGDYATSSVNRLKYGYNTEAFVRVALSELTATTKLRRFHIVSDDVGWCRQHLEPVARLFGDVFYSTAPNAVEDFLAVTYADAAILTNSTFSMWAGYLGSALTPGRPTYTPLFDWRRSLDSDAAVTRSKLWLPQWNAIDDIPGGWGVPVIPKR